MPGMIDGDDGAVITTVRVVGVPQHSTDTEFNCWFMFAHGFEKATLGPSQQNSSARCGWARFSSAEAAHAAIAGLNGRQLTAEQSPEQPVLSAEFAKKNFKTHPSDRQRITFDVPPPIVLPRSGLASASVYPSIVPPPAAVRVASPVGDAPTCSTLYIRDLDANATEEELHWYFLEKLEGFERLKFTPPSPGKTGMCWAKFFSPWEAQMAQQELSASALPSNPTAPLQVQFARNDLDDVSNRKRDFDATGGSSPISLAGGWGGPIGSPPSPFVQKIAAVLAARVPASVPVAHDAGAGGGTASWGGARGHPPCDTMFVGNLAGSVTEYELANTLWMLPGFVRVKFVGEGTAKPMAFAHFESTDACVQAIKAFDGSYLPSAPLQVIKCSFSKNSLGKPSGEKRGRINLATWAPPAGPINLTAWA